MSLRDSEMIHRYFRTATKY